MTLCGAGVFYLRFVQGQLQAASPAATTPIGGLAPAKRDEAHAHAATRTTVC